MARSSGDGGDNLFLREDRVFLREDRAVLVDWNWAEIGNPAVDRAFWAPSLQFDGGPAPEAQLRLALPWAARALGLPEP